MKYCCKRCSIEFEDKPSTKRIYCSRKCKEFNQNKGKNHPSWKGGKKEYECLLCKTLFKRKPSNIKKGQNIFCSCKCQAIWKCKHQKRTETDIEIRMKEVLIKNKFQFEEQVVFPKICIADFFLPKHNLAIFCDGEYWHHYPDGKPRDEEQVEELNKIGVKAIRLWGKQITDDPILYLKKGL